MVIKSTIHSPRTRSTAEKKIKKEEERLILYKMIATTMIVILVRGWHLTFGLTLVLWDLYIY